MNEEELKVLQTLIEKTNELYDLYFELAKLDNEKGTSKQLDLIADIHILIEELDLLLEPYCNNATFISNAKAFLQQLNSNVNVEDIFGIFQKKSDLVIKRIYNELTKLEIKDAKSLAKNLKGYFKSKANEKIEYSAYLNIAIPNFNLELSIRTIELLDSTDFKKLKYTFAFLNSTLDFILSDDYYERVSHSFNQNTDIETTFFIESKMKDEFKKSYGILIFKKAFEMLTKVKNEKLNIYLRTILRTSALFIDDKTLQDLVTYLGAKNNEAIKELINKRKSDLKLANKFETPISKETLSIINNLFKITLTIKNTYTSLAYLEKDNHKNTSQYASMLTYLRFNLEEEKIIYEYFDMFPQEAVFASKYLDEIIYKKNYYYENVAVALKDDENELVTLRIAQKLDALALRNDDYFHDSIDEEDEEICSKEEDFTFIKHKMLTYNETYYYEIFNFLQDSFDDKALYFKYNLTFLNSKLESALLNKRLDNIPQKFNSFIEYNSPNLDPSFISNIRNAYALDKLSLFIEDIPSYDDKTIYNDSDDEEYDELLEENLEELASIERENVSFEEDEDNEELEDFEDKFYFNILLAKLKTCLLFADDNCIKIIKNKVINLKKYYEKGHNLIFKEILEILDSNNILKQNANSDIEHSKKI